MILVIIARTCEPIIEYFHLFRIVKFETVLGVGLENFAARMATRTAVATRRKESTSSRGSGGENFRVAVRVRPLIERELKSGAPQVRPYQINYLSIIPSLSNFWSKHR